MPHARIIVATPDPAECEVMSEWLASDGFEPIKRTTLAGAAEAIQNQAFDLFIADSTFAFRYRLHDASQRRIRNNKIPTVVLGDLDSRDQTGAEGRRVMHLTRPVERAALVCLVSMALFDGRTGRKSPRKNIEHLKASVNGGPAFIIDVSNEGLRLLMARDGRPTPPPIFRVSVPMIAVPLTVKRAWTSVRTGRTERLLCGGSIADPRSERAWRMLVETLPAIDGPTIDFSETQSL